MKAEIEPGDYTINIHGDFALEIPQPQMLITIKGNSWKQLTSGFLYNCAISMNDQAYCWGYNYYGQLGNGDDSFSNANIPMAVFQENDVLKGQKITQIKSGSYTTCALTDQNKMYCWGRNPFGMLGNTDYTNDLSNKPVLVNKPIENTVPQRFINEIDIIDFTVGANHVCALDTLNRAFCWGSNVYGELGMGSGTTAMKNNIVNAFAEHEVKKIAAGENYTCILSSDNNVYCTGRVDYGQLGTGHVLWSANNPSYIANIMQIASGNYTGKVRDIIASGKTACLIDANNEAYCWGNNGAGLAGKPHTSERDYTRYFVTAPATQYQAESRSYYTAYYSTRPNKIPGIEMTDSDISRIDLSNERACIVNDKYDAYCWGVNQTSLALLGKKGMHADYSYTALRVDMLSQLVKQEDGTHVEQELKIKQIIPGTGSNCLIAINDKAYCWGTNNSYGVLGSGDNKSYYSATEVVSPAD